MRNRAWVVSSDSLFSRKISLLRLFKQYCIDNWANINVHQHSNTLHCIYKTIHLNTINISRSARFQPTLLSVIVGFSIIWLVASTLMNFTMTFANCFSRTSWKNSFGANTWSQIGSSLNWENATPSSQIAYFLWFLKNWPIQSVNENPGANSKTDLGVIKFLNMLLFWPEAICLPDTVKSVRFFSRSCLTCICRIFIFLLFAFSLLSFFGFYKIPEI